MNSASLALTTATAHRDYIWTDLVVVVALLAAIFLAGLYGDVVVGAAIFCIATAVAAGARLTAQSLRRLSRSSEGGRLDSVEDAQFELEIGRREAAADEIVKLGLL